MWFTNFYFLFFNFCSLLLQSGVKVKKVVWSFSNQNFFVNMEKNDERMKKIDWMFFLLNVWDHTQSWEEKNCKKEKLTLISKLIYIWNRFIIQCLITVLVQNLSGDVLSWIENHFCNVPWNYHFLGHLKKATKLFKQKKAFGIRYLKFSLQIPFLNY